MFDRFRSEGQKIRGMWIFQWMALVAVVSSAHSLAAVYEPASLTWIDPIIATWTDALRYLGLRIVKPCISGPLNPQFYVNEVGIAIWGVILSSATGLFQIARMPDFVRGPDVALDRIIRTRGWSAFRARLYQHAAVMLGAVPIIVLMTIVFLNGFHGYFIFKIKAADWSVVSFFSTVVIYLPGALIVPWALVAGNVFLKDFRDWTKVSSTKVTD
jgi:hypothetical protein